METLNGPHTNLLLQALERLHAHGTGSFRQRLFDATQVMFRECGQAFEVFSLKDNSHLLETDITFPTSYTTQDFIDRIAELVRSQHPGYALIVDGHLDAFRMSDLLTHQQFHRTDLYNEVFRPMDKKFQLALPFACSTCFGALTLNRRDRDFTAMELAMAVPFARHVGIAYQAHVVLHGIPPTTSKAMAGKDYVEWKRLGLTLRECEVLDWMTQGKRDSEIAIILGISLRTVNVHVRSVLTKLKVENRTAAAAMVSTK